MITNLRNKLLERIQGILGNNYSRLSFSSDISQNTSGKTSKKYSVSALGAFEAQGVTSSITLDQQFEVTLTDSFQTPKNSLNDNEKYDKGLALQDKALELYSDFVSNKSLISSQIIIVNNFNMNELEYLDEEKVVILKFNFNLKYKI